MILLCAATSWEAEPLALHWGMKEQIGSEQLPENTLMGSVGANRVVLLRTGVGPENIRGSLSKLDSKIKPQLALSVGFAGALHPQMHSGDIAADLRGLELEWIEKARRISREQEFALHLGPMLSSDTLLHTPESKRAFSREARGMAVDMESNALRDWCRAGEIPFASVRVILDELDQSLPPHRPEGESFLNLCRYALSHWQDTPLFFLLYRRQKRGMRNLASFLNSWIGT